jgi:hypothetical protein
MFPNGSMDSLKSLSLVLLVVLAGCGGATGPATPADTSTNPSNTQATNQTTQTSSQTSTTATHSEPTINVSEQGAELGDVNATLVWQRVGRLVSVDSMAPSPVVVKPASEDSSVSELPGFYRSLGARGENYVLASSPANGRYNSGSYQPVVLRRGPNTTDAEMEAILAHEFAHAYQLNAEELLPNNTTWFAELAVNEGTAELVEWRYTNRYMDDYDSESRLDTVYQQLWGIQQTNWAAYLYGARYARNYSDSDAPIASMYDDPPTTGEQILHGLPPGSEPPRPLSVHGDAAGDWSLDSKTPGLGEPTLRHTLEIGLSRSRAVEAAAGWGNDRKVTFTAGNRSGYAWVVRWDSASEAAEFESAFAAYQQHVSEPLALRSVGSETTVILSGDESFVRNATASGTPANVTVAP